VGKSTIQGRTKKHLNCISRQGGRQSQVYEGLTVRILFHRKGARTTTGSTSGCFGEIGGPGGRNDFGEKIASQLGENYREGSGARRAKLYQVRAIAAQI